MLIYFIKLKLMAVTLKVSRIADHNAYDFSLKPSLFRLLIAKYSKKNWPQKTGSVSSSWMIPMIIQSM
jgi:hypothetical protein